jgi:hypothetical protein
LRILQSQVGVQMASLFVSISVVFLIAISLLQLILSLFAAYEPKGLAILYCLTAECVFGAVLVYLVFFGKASSDKNARFNQMSRVSLCNIRQGAWAAL